VSLRERPDRSHLAPLNLPGLVGQLLVVIRLEQRTQLATRLATQLATQLVAKDRSTPPVTGTVTNARTSIASWRSAFGTYSRIRSYRATRRAGDRTRTGDVQLGNEARHLRSTAPRDH